jgi:predicted O-linked N-acetylglucosamine transferase (SPINDLY family)
MKFSVEQTLRKARALSRAGDKAAAEQLYREVLQRFPGNKSAAAELQCLSFPAGKEPPEADLDRLVALYGQRLWADALAHAGPLLAQFPRSEILHNIVGAICVGMGRLDEAIAHYDQAIAIAPDFIEAFNNRGNVLADLKRFDQAIADFDQAIRLKPDYADSHVNRGITLGKLKRPEEALAAFNLAISLDPRQPEAYNNRGNLLLRQYRLCDALADYDKAVALRPTYAHAFVNRGNALRMLKQPADAVASYDRAIALAPSLADAHLSRGTALRELKRYEEALASYREAVRLNPAHAAAFAELLHIEAHLCIWPEPARDTSILDRDVDHGGVPPFYMLELDDNPQRQLRCAQAWCNEKFGGIRPSTFNRGKAGDRIRVGYFSADFHNHATMYLMARLFELHDRSQFEIHAFSYGAKAQDEMRTRLVNAVDVFHDVAASDDREIAELANAEGIDIAVDLKGYTDGGRPGIFAYRAAPVQIGYLGYPGTMGADFIDYLLADPVTVPDSLRQNYSESIIHLPHSYQVNDNQRRISDETISRKDFGLPEDGFIFCCFNANYKISPAEFDIWMRLLRQVDGSVLWLLRGSEIAANNLRREAERRGVDPQRLVFADPAPLAGHLARHRCADLFLDTFTVNAHTTASDALWAGLPVVTKLGRSFVARVAGSLLHALDLPELVTETAADYEQLALDLATDPVKLAAVKSKLAKKRLTAPLFDPSRTTRDIEAVYRRLWEKMGIPLTPRDRAEPDYLPALSVD